MRGQAQVLGKHPSKNPLQCLFSDSTTNANLLSYQLLQRIQLEGRVSNITDNITYSVCNRKCCGMVGE